MNGDVSVQEMMDREYVGVSESDGVLETVELMLEEGAESVVVLRGSEPVGVMTERDALALVVEGDPESATVAEAMTGDVPTIGPDAKLAEAADLMSTRATKRVLVSDGDEPVGVLSEHDVFVTSPFGSGGRAEPLPTERAAAAGEAGVAATGMDDRAVDGAGSTGRMEDQAICEACGSLARDLTPFNGQLLCSDCRDI